MCCQNFGKRVIPFLLALIIGLGGAKFLQTNYIEVDKQEAKTVAFGNGIGTGGGYREDTDKKLEATDLATKPLRILSKPRANYTDLARQNGVQGTVRVKVLFSASGKIETAVPISSLPDGLTEQAILAAKQIEFQPQIQNGQPVSITKVVEYSFTIY